MILDHHRMDLLAETRNDGVQGGLADLVDGLLLLSATGAQGGELLLGLLRGEVGDGNALHGVDIKVTVVVDVGEAARGEEFLGLAVVVLDVDDTGHKAGDLVLVVGHDTVAAGDGGELNVLDLGVSEDGLVLTGQGQVDGGHHLTRVVGILDLIVEEGEAGAHGLLEDDGGGTEAAGGGTAEHFFLI
eukprot:132327_1